MLNSLNEVFRTQLTLVTNCTRPDIETILDKYLADYNLEETTKTIQMTQEKEEGDEIEEK